MLRLMMACRGTLAVVLMTATAIGLASLLHTSAIEFAVGIVFSLMTPFFMREPSWRQRQRSLLMMALPAAGVAVAISVLQDQVRIADPLFLVLVFFCFLLQARSARAIGMGLIAVITSYVSLYLELPPAALPVQLLSIAVAVPVVSVACFVLVPMRPVATLRRTVQAVQGRAAQVLQDSARLAADDPGAVRRLRRSLARLNEAALAADDQLAMLYPVRSAPLRLHLMDLELAAARLGTVPLESASLELHARRLRRGRWTARHRGAADAARSPVATALADVARAAAALGDAAAALPTAAPPQPTPPQAPGPLAWRVALRVTIASALAMAGGMAVSPQRWFWAVITTYVVLLNTRSRGETVYKGVQRLMGTLLGLVGGLLLASLLAGDGPIQVLALIAAVFGLYYLFLVSYTLGIFCVTMLLGLVYSLLGSSIEPLLVLRLEETAVGAAAAMVVAVCILPLRTRDQVAQSGQAVLRALVAAVGASRRALAGEAGAVPVPAIRAVDRQVADLRLSLIPLMAGRFLLRRSEPERPVPALLDCVHWARMLAVAATSPDAGASARAHRIEQRLAALAEGDRPRFPQAQPCHRAALASGKTDVALAQLEQATMILAERLDLGALHGFELGD